MAFDSYALPAVGSCPDHNAAAAAGMVAAAWIHTYSFGMQARRLELRARQVNVERDRRHSDEPLVADFPEQALQMRNDAVLEGIDEAALAAPLNGSSRPITSCHRAALKVSAQFRT